MTGATYTMTEYSGMNHQLPLNLSLKDSATFESYVPGTNEQAVNYLRRLADSAWEPGVYLWGSAGTGKSHLLQAVCHAAGAAGTAAIYLPLQLADQFPCEALNGMENVSQVCIDDIQAIAGRRDWETALVHLIDRIHAAGGRLVMAGNAAPAALGLDLPQLRSRLTGGLTLLLKPLDAAGKLQALHWRAGQRGLELTAAAGRYLVRHYGRDMGVLCTALELIDHASLAAQRRPTIPFMRHVLAGSDLKTE
jgi:DnaA family protein